MPPNEPYHPSEVNEDGWDRRNFRLKWENKQTGLQGGHSQAGSLAPGEAKLWLDKLHKHDRDNVYWFEAA